MTTTPEISNTTNPENTNTNSDSTIMTTTPEITNTIIPENTNTKSDSTIMTTTPNTIKTSTPETTNMSTALESTLDTSTLSEITDIQKEQTAQNSTDIESPFILGFDKYMYISSYKKITFNCYFIITIQTFFPKVIHFYVKINYRNYRNLQDNENGDADEETKSLCNLVDSNIKYQVKYECELEINEKDKDILNVKSLDKFEFEGKKIEIQSSSFLHSLYKNNMENAKGDIFNKPLYILENSVVNNNEKEFNITGNLIGDNFNYNNKLVFQFHSDKNNSEVTN
jgi:hypothetical protein